MAAKKRTFNLPHTQAFPKKYYPFYYNDLQIGVNFYTW